MLIRIISKTGLTTIGHNEGWRLRNVALTGHVEHY